ncbi:hypothetical protein K466DRAFT_606341, partial [Polyporus arcularius HHB13444]
YTGYFHGSYAYPSAYNCEPRFLSADHAPVPNGDCGDPGGLGQWNTQPPPAQHPLNLDTIVADHAHIPNGDCGDPGGLGQWNTQPPPAQYPLNLDTTVPTPGLESGSSPLTSTPLVDTPPTSSILLFYPYNTPAAPAYGNLAEANASTSNVYGGTGATTVGDMDTQQWTATGSSSQSSWNNPTLPHRVNSADQEPTVGASMPYIKQSGRPSAAKHVPLVPEHLPLEPVKQLIEELRPRVTINELAANAFHTYRDQHEDLRRVQVKVSCIVPGCAYVGDPSTLFGVHVLPVHYRMTSPQAPVECLVPDCNSGTMKRGSMPRHIMKTHLDMATVHCPYCHSTIRDEFRGSGSRARGYGGNNKHMLGCDCPRRAEYIEGGWDALLERIFCDWCAAEVVLQ